MTQKEQENFLKNAILIVDYSKTALITLVDLDLHNKSLTFEQFLNKNRHRAYHLCYYRGKCCECVPSYMLPSVRIIYPAQIELLYDKLSPKLACHGSISRRMTFPPVCCSSAQNGISTNVLDISLARAILTNFCHEVFWYSCLKCKGNSLEDFLNSNKHTIYHLLNNNTNCCLCPSGFVFPCDRPQIIQSEWNNMFSSLLLPCTNDRKRPYKGTTSICSVSATPGICIHHLDLNLQEVLLQYCCPLRKIVTDLADIRNVKYGHVQEARMSDAEYEQVFNEIENNLMAIATVCGNIGEVKQSLQDLQKRTLDETLCLQYHNSLLEHLRYVNETKDIVESCCKEVTSSVGKINIANKQVVKAVTNEVKDFRIRIPRKLDKFYMQSRREQRSVQHSVAKLARQCKDKSKEVEQQIDSVVVTIGDLKMDIDTRFDTVENTVGMISKNVEKATNSIPIIIKKCIDGKGFSKRSKFIDLTMLEIDNHSKENTFVTTSVVSSCVQLLKYNNVLVLTGRAGSGKSRNSLEILRQYKVLGYDVLKLSDLKDFEDSFKGDVDTIILCEDIFGRTNNVFTQNSDVEILDRVHACVNMGKTKVIFTIRDIVKRSCKWVFSSYRLFNKSVEVDLSSKELELKLEEKKALFIGYCHVNNFKIVGLNEQENFKDEVILDDKVTVKLNLITLNQVIKTDPILGFPQTCCLFTGNRKFTRLGEAFFKHPSSCLTEEIENLRKSGKEIFSDKIKYSLLVYVLLNGDILDKNHINSNQMSEIIISCYHKSAKTISEHYIYDAIDEMIGQYLIKGYCTNSYQFQHQTVFESVLISYSRINPVLILSKLAFDFIREMVRLEGFQEKEGEIVMKISVRYYPNLCKRIIQILQNDYCLKSQSLIQLLCDSEIMRDNDITFVEHLIDEAHRVLPLQDLKIIISFQDESESVNFYLPVALLEHVIKQKNMTESLFPLLKHTRSIFQNDSNNEIIQCCKASVLSVFLSAVVQEHSEDILSLILSMIQDFKLTRDNNEYFTKVVCATPSTNKKLMIWLLENIGMKYLDRKALCFEICFRSWTNLLQLLTKDPSTSGIDLTCLIKELCSSGKYEIVKWLVEKINCSLISMDTNINGKKDENIHWLLENIDKSTFNMQTAINELCTSGNIHIVQWFMQSYKSISVLDMQTVLNEACRAGNICVVTWLIESTDKSFYDLNQAILAACISKRNDLITLLVDSLDPLSFDMNILLRMCRKGQSGIINQLLRIIRHFTSPEVIDCARKACEQDKLEIVQWLVTALNSNNYLNSNSLFNMNMALKIACQGEDDIHILDFLLQNVVHEKFDMTAGIETAIRVNSIKIVQMLLKNDAHQSIYTNIALNYACCFNRFDITKALLQSISSTAIDISTMKSVLNKGIVFNRPDIVKHVLEKCDHSLFDMKGIFTESCYNEKFEILEFLITFVDHKLLDMNKAIYTAFDEFPKISLRVIGLLLKHSDCSLLDMAHIREIVHRACRNNEINKIKILAGTVDKTLLGFDSVMNDACKNENLPVVKWLVENVDNKLFDLKTALDCAIGEDKEDDDDSEFSNFDIIDFLLKRLVTENILPYIAKKHRLMRVACFHFNKNIVQLLIEKVDNSLLGIDTVMNRACSSGRLDVVKCLLENADNTLFDVKAALDYAIGEDKEEDEYNHDDDDDDDDDDEVDDDDNLDFEIIDLLLQRCIDEDVSQYITKLKRLTRVACFKFKKDIIQLLIDKVDNSLLGLDIVMDKACLKRRLDVVKWLIENFDNTLFDVITALDYAIYDMKDGCCLDDDDHGLGLDIIDLLLQRFVDEDFLRYKTHFKILMKVACFHCKKDIVQFLIDKVDNSLLGIDIVMNRACSQGSFAIVKWLLENVANTLFDVKIALDCAIGEDYYYDDDDDDDNDDDDDDDFDFEIIDLLLQRFNDVDVLPYIKHLKRLMRVSCFHFKKDIVQLLIDKVDNSLLGIDTVMNRACSKEKTDVVKWLVEHVDNTLLNLNTAMSNVCSRPDGLDLAMWLLANIDDKEIDMNTSFINACSNGNLDLLNWLLETYGRQSFDAKTALNVSCLNGHLFSVQYIIEIFDIQHFDLTTAMIKVCRSKSAKSVQIGNCMWEKFNHDLFDKLKAMNNACRYGNLGIAEWLFEKNNIDVFDMSEALNSACQCNKSSVVKWIISKIPTDKINVQTAIKNTCGNNSNDLSIIKCFVENSGKTNLDLNILVKEACTYERTDVIEWMLENCDKDSFRILDLLTSLVNIDNSLETNVIDKHDKSERNSKKQNLILKILKNNTYISCDYNSILSKACSEGWMDIFRWILTEIDNTDLNITDAVNIASRNGTCELINWSLSNLNPDQIDANTILIEASGFGFIEVVQSISSRPDKCKLNFKNAMNDACEYGRGEVVTWLLKNNAKDVFDLSMVMSAACRNGWMDTLNWILENADYILLNIDYAILEACAAGNINIVRLLFSTFDKKLFDQQKLSARICEKGCNEKVVLFLLENLNADVFQMDSILNKASGFGWLEVVSWIMENGPEINTVGSAFENACVNCEIDIVKYLQDKISQGNIQTGLQTACKSGFEEIVEVLLDCLNHEQIDIATLLNEACRRGEQTVVEVLLRKVDNVLFDKRAAINEACRSKLPEELVHLLIKDLQNNDFDNEVVSENARKHSWTKVLMQLKRKS